MKDTSETVEVFLLLAFRTQDGRVVGLFCRLQILPLIANKAVISALETQFSAYRLNMGLTDTVIKDAN
jgi:hypothetical protein